MATVVSSPFGVADEHEAAGPSSQAQDSAGRGHAMFTCLSCSIAYPNPEDQRAHYRTDLHRYNMKRRVANLPPVRADVFNAKVLERQTIQQEQEQSNASTSSRRGATGASQDRCQTCRKSFSSANAFQSHLNSRKHKENEAKSADSQSEAAVQQPAPLSPDADAQADPLVVRIKHSSGLDTVDELEKALPDVQESQRPNAPMSLQVAEDATEEEIQAAIDAKVASSRRIDPTHSCIFCSATSFANLSETVAHMTRFHGFFVPEREYLTDEEGLLKYLADKVCVGNICLYCNGKGRGFATGEAVRKHMVDKSHCKVAYDTEEDKMELSDFYDFTSSYPDAQWEDVSDEDGEEGEFIEVDEEGDSEGDSEGDDDDAATLRSTGVRYGDNEFELVLPSGARLGHRSLRRYYNQSLRPTGSAYDESGTSGRQVAHRLLQMEKASRDPLLVENRGGHMVRARNRGEAREAKKHISTYRDAARREHFKTQVGFKNNHQKHFRDPMLQ